jgi:hypothetical protein
MSSFGCWRRGAAALFLVCACGASHGTGGPSRDGGTVDVSDPNATLCARYGVDAQAPGATATPFALVQQIFDDNCIACHVAGTVLDLSAGNAWKNLVNQPATPDEACGGTLVVPGNPSASFLFQKLTQDNPCAGARMPRGDFGGGSLPSCVTDHVGAWISEGAPGPESPDGRAASD